jgi:[ribosomal protein S5]-alanine N-acetyltransferase
MNNTPSITLRNSTEDDIEIFFYNQLDEEANYLAAFTPKDPTDKEAYTSKWKRLLKDDTINMKTILYGTEIAGTVAKFEMEGNAEITYWLGKQYWGKGIATKALRDFLPLENMRPIFGHVAYDNYGSIRVLEKCGFERIGTARLYSNARQKEIEEIIFRFQ